MAIVVLVLWLFTAGAGFYLLLTSSLGRARPARPADSALQPAPASAGPPAVALPSAAPASASASAPAAPVGVASRAAAATPSRRDARRASRERWDPPALVASRQAPILPGARSLVEFAHPASGIIGLAFWLGFTLIHNRALGWIGFALAATTACIGLAWFTVNTRAARRADPTGPAPAPSFAGRLIALHGSAATLTLAASALAALVFKP
jgi:hypothetical protein